MVCSLFDVALGLVAAENGRNSIGYEIDKNLLPLIKTKIGFDPSQEANAPFKISIIVR